MPLHSDSELTDARIAANLAAVRARIDAALARAGREPGSATLVAVTKTVGIETVARLIAAGQHHFGENRVDQLVAKAAAFPEARFDLIGSLQTNKVRHVVGTARLIHSVDSLRLLDAIDERARAIGVVQPVLIQVNVSGEESKHGITPAELPSVLTHASQLVGARVDGLMTMAPLGDPESARRVFGDLRTLREEVGALRGVAVGDVVSLTQLSMGMSNDFEVAIEEGATLVRVGSALFV